MREVGIGEEVAEGFADATAGENGENGKLGENVRENLNGKVQDIEP